MTTKQRLEYMLHQAAENKKGSTVGDPVTDTVEGKLVLVQRMGYGRKVFGQRAPEFDAYVNGVNVMMWRHGRKHTLEALYKRVSEDHIAKEKEQQEKYEREWAAREAKEKAEREAKEERERPAREVAAELMAAAFNQMDKGFNDKFSRQEIRAFLREALD